MAWTDEMVEELKRLWDQGVTTGEIGRRLNISKNSIVGKVHRLGLSGRPSPIKKKDPNAPSTKPTKPAKTTKPIEQNKPAPAPKPVVKAPAPEPKAQPTSIQTKPALAKPELKPTVQPTKIEPSLDDDIKLACSITPKPTYKHNGTVGLTDLDNHTCRWPIGDPKDANFHFCGKKVRLGQTYCEEHAAIAYVKPTRK